MASNQHSDQRSLGGRRGTRTGNEGRGLVAVLGLALGAGALVAGAPSLRAADKPAADKPAGAKDAGAAKKGAAAALPADAGPPRELPAEVKDKLMFLSDGKQHVVAVIPFGPLTENLYYGDGKV